MEILIFGAGNMLCSDEGFGVHAVRVLEERYQFPEDVELYDAGTMGILATFKLEEAKKVFIVDVLAIDGATPGEIRRYTKDDVMLDRIPVKLSPHQIGLQEVMLVSEMRGQCPDDIVVLGVVPGSLEPGVELSPACQQAMDALCDMLVAEIRGLGFAVTEKSAAVVHDMPQGVA